ncbi:Endo alpha-1,4 polygalactosaminidase [Candidatus Methanophagaceae archaeon]|jgi:endo-alpha-1,4-polygalactosaminidase (GH114 family)|nr:Endo alpha-1,4 polygalactosaminidase [Methanophagales archaeon]
MSIIPTQYHLGILAAGFDGMYLDIIDAYEYFKMTE